MNHKSATFWEHVRALREQGLIGRVWKTTQLGEYLEQPSGQYAATTITANPYNSSVSSEGDAIGDFVKKGGVPKAWRVGRGQFQLIVDPADDEETQSEQIRLAMARAEQLRAQKRRDASNHAGIAFASRANAIVQPKSVESDKGFFTPIPIALAESERQAMAGLSTEQKAMAIVRDYLVKKYSHHTESEEDRESADISVSIDGVTVIIEAKRVTPKNDRYPLRGKPYRYDRPYDPVAFDDWEILK